MIPKDAPRRIYLQHDPERTGGLFSEAYEVTWCPDRINSNDITYIRSDLIRKRKRVSTKERT